MHSWCISQDRKARAGFWHCVRRRSVIAILLVGLPSWVEPASAQKVYRWTVSIHEEMRGSLTDEDIKGILESMSKLTTYDDNNCPMKFELKGPVQTFTSAPADINDADDLEKAHSVAADVKIVRKINFCLGKYKKEGFVGCAWRAEGRQKTVIVTNNTAAPKSVWLHEFGHTTCLPHRIDHRFTLMTPCAIKTDSYHINDDECRHFLAGPKLCPLQDPVVVCPKLPNGALPEPGQRQD